MIHLGDIKNINGAEIPVVDVITGGSPCQDLSVAGKRQGLNGERSGLFMEQIRIIKEMREHDRSNGRTGEFVRPRYMVWENVPGAFSSGTPKGEDFRIVLEEIAKVSDETAVIPRPEGGKWSQSGCIVGDGWSIAWRVHDAQFWGVPQRRKRISLVADFGGSTAPEILFERKGLSGDSEPCGTEREETAGAVGNSIETANRAISFQERAGKPGGGKGILIQNERTGALSTLNNQSVCVGVDVYNHAITGDIAATLNASSGDSPTHSGPSVMTFEPGAASRVGGHVYEDDVAGTVRANAGDNQQAVVYGISAYESNAMKSPNPNSGIYEAETARTLDLNGGSPACNQGGMAVVEPLCVQRRFSSVNTFDNGVAPTLEAGAGEGGNNTPMVCIEGNGSRPSHQGDGYSESEIMYTLNSTEYHAVLFEPRSQDGVPRIHGDIVPTLNTAQGGQRQPCIANMSIVRRLTPLECERLQGYPDFYTDIGEYVDTKGKVRQTTDSARYKALGNSIALPYWKVLARRIAAQYDRDITMGSLFDGIGGFPLAFEHTGAKAVWASEIEEFCIAVTKRHFGEETMP